jgi:hypothetical protein
MNLLYLLYTLIYPFCYVIIGLIVGYTTTGIGFPYNFINPNFYGGNEIGPFVFPAVIVLLAGVFYSFA